MTAPAETFAGFGEGAVEFYDGLLADNSKAYWTDHRGIYESDVLAPMRALLAVLEPEFGPGKVFRPYRDVRFSRDKTPYKTALRGHRRSVLRPGLGGRAAGRRRAVPVGPGPARPLPHRRRRRPPRPRPRGPHRDRHGHGRGRGAARPAGDRLATRPRGVAPDHPRLELLRHRGLYAHRGWEPDDVLHEAATAERVAAVWRATRPLTDWLDDHVGPPEHSR